MNRTLGPIDRGVLANLLLIPSIAATLVSCNWEKILRSYLNSNREKSSEIVDITLYLWFLQSLLAISITIVYVLYNKQLYEGIIDFAIVVALVAIPVQLGANYVISILTCLKNPLHAYKIKLIAVLCYLILIIYFAEQTILTVKTAFVANQMIGITILAIAGYVLGKISLRIPNFAKLKKYAIQLFSSFPSHAAESIAIQLDIYLMIHYAGFAAAGSYIAFRILELPFKVISLSSINVGSSISDLDRAAYISKFVYRPFFFITTILILAFMSLSFIKSMLNYVIGFAYADMYWMLGYLLIAFALNCVYETAVNAILMLGDRKSYYRIKLTIAMIKISDCPIESLNIRVLLGLFRLKYHAKGTDGLILHIPKPQCATQGNNQTRTPDAGYRHSMKLLHTVQIVVSRIFLMQMTKSHQQ